MVPHRRGGPDMLPPTEVQRSGALWGSIPRGFHGSSGGPLALLNLSPQPYLHLDGLVLVWHVAGIRLDIQSCAGHFALGREGEHVGGEDLGWLYVGRISGLSGNHKYKYKSGYKQGVGRANLYPIYCPTEAPDILHLGPLNPHL